MSARFYLRFILVAVPLYLILSTLPMQTLAASPSATAGKAGLTARSPLPRATLFEIPTEALAQWRRTAALKPSLVVFSFDPMLHPYPKILKNKIASLLRSADRRQLLKHGSFYRADPWLLPPQTVGAALEGRLFSSIYWVYPALPDQKAEALELSSFKDGLPKLADFSKREIAGFALHDGIFSGEYHRHPFFAVHPGVLPAIQGPVVVFIDLSYLADSYKNEVKTPIYKLLRQLASSLLAAHWDVRATGICLSQGEGIVSPDFRFLGKDLQALLAKPTLLDGAMPHTWYLRGQALYQATFMQFSESLKFYRQEAKRDPDDPSVQYDLYRGYRAMKMRTPMLKALDRAVAGDPGYVYGYLELAAIANKTREYKLAAQLYQKAARLLPDNPYIPLNEAEVLQKLGKKQAAKKLLAKLKKLPWSTVYHPEVPGELTQLEKTRPDTK